MPRVRVALVTAAMTMSPVACSLLTDYPGTGGSGATDASTSDALVAQDATADDKSAEDGASTDSATPSDSSSLADGADAGSWCAAQGTHAFCADFDDGTLPAGVTTNVFRGDATPAAGLSTSPPNALRISIDANDAGSNNSRAIVTKQLKSTTTGVRCAFDFAMEQPPSVLSDIAWIDLAVSGTSFYYVDLSTDELALYDSRVSNDVHAYYSQKHVVGTFVRVEIVIDLAAKTASVSFDGVAALGTSVPLSNPGTAFGGVTLNLGVRYPTPTDNLLYRYDNVVCDFL